MSTIINDFKGMLLEEQLFSKVPGRRNWAIRVEHKDKIAYVGKFKALADRGFLSPTKLKTIAEKKIRWYEFTYKKDFMPMVFILKCANYDVKFLN